MLALAAVRCCAAPMSVRCPQQLAPLHKPRDGNGAIPARDELNILLPDGAKFPGPHPRPYSWGRIFPAPIPERGFLTRRDSDPDSQFCGCPSREDVRGKDVGNGGGARLGNLNVPQDLVTARREEVGVGEDERGGEPDGAPAAVRAESLMARHDTMSWRSTSGRRLCYQRRHRRSRGGRRGGHRRKQAGQGWRRGCGRGCLL